MTKLTISHTTESRCNAIIIDTTDGENYRCVRVNGCLDAVQHFVGESFVTLFPFNGISELTAFVNADGDAPQLGSNALAVGMLFALDFPVLTLPRENVVYGNALLMRPDQACFTEEQLERLRKARDIALCPVGLCALMCCSEPLSVDHCERCEEENCPAFICNDCRAGGHRECYTEE